MKIFKNKKYMMWILTSVCVVMVGVLIYAAINISRASAILNAINAEAEIVDAEPEITEAEPKEPQPPQMPQPEEEPQPEDVTQNPAERTTPSAVKGIYVTANRAGLDEYFLPIVEICSKTEINAMVIDVKNDLGQVTFKKAIPMADALGISTGFISDISYVIDTLNELDMYKIARVVAFKDNTLCDVRPDLYIKDANGDVWRDKDNSAWINPYNKDAWEYLLEIAEGAIDAGFDEVQFDYIRFDTSSRLNDADFGDTEGKSRTEIITDFTEYASERIRKKGAFVSADVFGTIITIPADGKIVGQDYAAMAAHLDYICPMIYPSHYALDSFDIAHPDTEPYKVILAAMEKSNEVLQGIPGCAVVRPWLQGFTANYLQKYIPYTPVEIKDQIRAVYDAGQNEWLIWNPLASYDAAAYEPLP